MTVDDLRTRMSSKEMSLWQAYFQVIAAEAGQQQTASEMRSRMESKQTMLGGDG